MGRKVWAIVWPTGRVLADSEFKSEKDAWKVGLGWPNPAEIARAKREGVRVLKVSIIKGD